MKKEINLIISILIGISIFLLILFKIGISKVLELFSNINLVYFFIFFLVSSSIFLFYNLKLKMILNSYYKNKKKINFFKLLKQTIAGFSISYITPSVRIGGEPMKAYMLKKEFNIPYSIGGSSVVVDKYIEGIGTLIIGIAGVVLLITNPNIVSGMKITFSLIMLFFLFFAFLFYNRCVKNKPTLSFLLNYLKHLNFKSLNKINTNLRKIEKEIGFFFRDHKREFWKALGIYIFTIILFIIESKFAFLSLGVNLTISQIILSLALFGLISIIPIPGALGLQELTQSTLFFLLMNDPLVGFGYSLLHRLRDIFFTSLGIGIIFHFSGGRIFKLDNPKLKCEKQK